MSQRFAADQGLQLLQNIALDLESYNGEYSDSESDEINNVIVDIPNLKDSSDSDGEYTDQEAPTNTDNGVRTRSSSNNDEQTILGKDGAHRLRSVSSKSLQDDYNNTIFLEFVLELHHISNPASYVAVLFLYSATFSKSLC